MRTSRIALALVGLTIGLATPLAAQAAAGDSGFISTGRLPRIESDPSIRRIALSVEPTYTDKESEDQLQFAFKYGAPLRHGLWSWQLSLPIEHVDSAGKQVTGLGESSLRLNRVLSMGVWRQAASLELFANTASDPSLGDHQWEIQPIYSIGRWFSPSLSAGLLLSWSYGFAVDSGHSRKDVIEPRTVVAFHLHGRADLALDLRPRFDLARHEFYSTLMVMASAPLGRDIGGQAGFEFPLSQLAAKRVENSRIYLDFSYGL